MNPVSAADYDLIEAYLLGKLDAIERPRVEARSASDEAFRMETLAVPYADRSGDGRRCHRL